MKNVFKEIIKTLYAIFCLGDEPSADEPEKCMSTATLDFLSAGHSTDEKIKIHTRVRTMESMNIYEYTFSTSRWHYRVKNGQFTSGNAPDEMKINKI